MKNRVQDPDSPEAVLNRSSQEDPIVMYFIVKESLNMSIGKTAAQCAHASQMLLLKYFNLQNKDLTKSEIEQIDIFNDWLNSSFRKVVLRADDKEFEKIKLELKNKTVIVVDAGLTELEPGSETVIGLMPIYKSQVPKCIKKLQVLK